VKLARVAAADLWLERRRQEERVVGELDPLDAGVGRVGGDHHAGAPQRRLKALGETVAALVMASACPALASPRRVRTSVIDAY